MENSTFIFSFFSKIIYIFRELELAWKIDNCILLRDKRKKISQATVKVENFMNSSRAVFTMNEPLRHANTMRYKIHPLTFPGRKFQLHSSSIIALCRFPLSPLGSFRIKISFSPTPIFTWRKKKVLFTCSKHSRCEWEEKKSMRNINSDKIRKTKIGFVPSVINRKFGRTVWEAISFFKVDFIWVAFALS